MTNKTMAPSWRTQASYLRRAGREGVKGNSDCYGWIIVIHFIVIVYQRNSVEIF